MKPQKAGGPKIYQAFHTYSAINYSEKEWTCFCKHDGETTRGWGKTPNNAYNNWLYKTLRAEGLSSREAGARAAGDHNYD